jgi:hypothetical protein
MFNCRLHELHYQVHCYRDHGDASKVCVDIYDSIIKTLQSGYFCCQMLHMFKVRYLSRVPMHFLVSINHSLPTYFFLVLSYQFSLLDIYF